MPRFNPDTSNVHANTPIYDKGDYIVKVASSNPFAYSGDVKDKDGRVTGKKDVYGSRFSLKMVGRILGDGTLDRDLEGKDVAPFRAYWHNDASQANTKRFFLAAMGYDRNAEEMFNEDFWKDVDLSIDCDDDYENVVGGSSWNTPVGKNVRVSLDSELYNGNMQQKFGFFDIAGKY